MHSRVGGINRGSPLSNPAAQPRNLPIIEIQKPKVEKLVFDNPVKTLEQMVLSYTDECRKAKEFKKINSMLKIYKNNLAILLKSAQVVLDYKISPKYYIKFIVSNYKKKNGSFPHPFQALGEKAITGWYYAYNKNKLSVLPVYTYKTSKKRIREYIKLQKDILGCEITGCGKKIVSRNLCSKHYRLFLNDRSKNSQAADPNLQQTPV